MNQIGCIVQARMGSSRLSGKVMMKLDDKNSVLCYVIDQLKSSHMIDKIVIATTNLKEDDIIVEEAKKIDIPYFRGDSTNVLDRYYQCAKKFGFSVIVRVTSDCPLIDPEIVDLLVQKFQSDLYDCVTNSIVHTFPQGTEAEVFSFKTLELAWKNAEKPSEKEHVTSYIYNNKNKFQVYNLKNSQDLSNFRWTIDRWNDYEFVVKIISKIEKRPIYVRDILKLLSKEPSLLEINKDHIVDEGYLKSLQEDKKFNHKQKKDFT